jgi:hypothetical protein
MLLLLLLESLKLLLGLLLESLQLLLVLLLLNALYITINIVQQICGALIPQRSTLLNVGTTNLLNNINGNIQGIQQQLQAFK